MIRDDFYVILNKGARIIATKICDTREYWASFLLQNALERQLPWGDDQKYVDRQKKLKDNYLYAMVRGKLRQRFYSSRLYKIL